MNHDVLLDGFRSIQDKNALGWAVLDGKSEQHVVRAIATSINRRSGTRIAHTEFSRMDLVILDGRLPSRPKRFLDADLSRIVMRYEAKAGQIFDFDRKHTRANNEYQGRHLNKDIKKLKHGSGAGLFFMYEAADQTRHLKYYKGEVVAIDDAVAVLCGQVPDGVLVGRDTLDCGLADGTNVKIHLSIFEPRTRRASTKDEARLDEHGSLSSVRIVSQLTRVMTQCSAALGNVLFSN